MGRMRASHLSPIVLGALVVGVRALLYRDLPALLTADSWDYLQAAGDIYHRADFFSPALRDVRLPGYPTLLALTYPLTGLRSDYVVLGQMGFGLVSVALGFSIGALLGSRLVSFVMMAFLGLSPVHLLLEHAVMAETVSLTLYVALALVGIHGLRRQAGWATWGTLGGLIGLVMLTRANAIAFGAVMVLGACVARWRFEAGIESSRVGRAVRCLRPALVGGVVALVVVLPWLGRNWAAYGRPSIFCSTNRNLLLYKAMHGRIDPTTPTSTMVNRELEYEWVDFEWLARFTHRYTTHEAEELASRILAEEIAKHPRKHVRHVAEAAAGFVGYVTYRPHERTGLLYWFRVLVNDVARMNALAAAAPTPTQTQDGVFVARSGDTVATRLLARAGALYLLPGRAIASLVVLGMLVIYLVRQRAWRRGDARVGVVLLLSVGYVATVVMHAVTLSDYDRYSSMFDFVLVLIAAVIADDVRSHGSRTLPLSAVVLLAVGLAACGAPQGIRDVNGDGRVVVACLGDSNTERHWPVPNSRKWCELAAAAAPDWTFRNYAVGGTTITPPVGAEGWVATQLEAALAEDAPDAVVLSFGTNDVRFGRPTGEIVEAYRDAVRRVEAARALAFVALAPPIFPPEPDHTAALAELNAALRAAFPARRLVDFHTGMSRDDFEPDGIHPTPAAQRKRAAAALRALREG